MYPLYSVYLHIPFCRHRCSYCDFNTYAGLESLIPDYIAALCREIQLVSQAAGERLKIHTVFFGGGTPSLLPSEAVEKIMGFVREAFDLSPEAEVSLEANPGTLSFAYLQDLHKLGVNRLSLGMQSAHPGELRLLDREHDLGDLIQSVRWARKAGFQNLNLDLIYGISGQALENWVGSLQMALSLQPEHLSLYALTLERGTPFEHWINRGLVAAPDDDLAADMYETGSEMLDQAGFVQYEISNWARRDPSGELLSCRHNLQYWRLLPYLGLGAGAHGFAKGIRTANVLLPGGYIQSMQVGEKNGQLTFPVSPAAVEVMPVDRQQEIGEYMMMGLRLVQEGVGDDEFLDRFGTRLEAEFGPVIERFRKRGLLRWDLKEGRLLLTEQARLVANQVFCEFI
jgi:oxygen-independent coproporphyrinogen-3 oxidase